MLPGAVPGTLLGSPKLAIRVLARMAEAMRPAALQRALELAQRLQMIPSPGGQGGKELSPWDVEWASEKTLPDSCSPLNIDLDLETVMAGLSDYIGRYMGLRLMPGLQQCVPFQSRDVDSAGGVPSSPSSTSPSVLPSSKLVGPSVGGLVLDLLDCVCSDALSSAKPGSVCMTGSSILSYTLEADGSPVGHIVLDPHGGYGTRFLTHGAMPPGESVPHVSPGASAPNVSAPTGSVNPSQGVKSAMNQLPSRVDLPVVMIGLGKWPRGGEHGPTVEMDDWALALVELTHEIGHALHFLLGSHAATVDAATRSGLRGEEGITIGGPCFHGMLPPIELLELPSTVLERLVCAAEHLVQILPKHITGQGITTHTCVAANLQLLLLCY